MTNIASIITKVAEDYISVDKIETAIKKWLQEQNPFANVEIDVVFYEIDDDGSLMYDWETKKLCVYNLKDFLRETNIKNIGKKRLAEIFKNIQPFNIKTKFSYVTTGKSYTVSALVRTVKLKGNRILFHFRKIIPPKGAFKDFNEQQFLKDRGFKTAGRAEWIQPIKIEMHQIDDKNFEIFVSNDYNRYVIHNKKINKEKFLKFIQPNIKKLIKTIVKVVE